MTNYFNISFSDLQIEAQEEVRAMVKQNLLDDINAMAEIKDKAEEELEEYGDSVSLKDRVDLLVDEEVDRYASEHFTGKGEV